MRNSILARLAPSRLLLKTGQVDATISEIHSAVKRKPQSAALLNLLKDAEAMRGQRTEAKTFQRDRGVEVALFWTNFRLS
jgi:predicted Zn-dependent protease